MWNIMQIANSAWKVTITGGSMLNGLHKKGLSKDPRAKVNNFPCNSCEAILDNIMSL